MMEVCYLTEIDRLLNVAASINFTPEQRNIIGINSLQPKLLFLLVVDLVPAQLINVAGFGFCLLYFLTPYSPEYETGY